MKLRAGNSSCLYAQLVASLRTRRSHRDSSNLGVRTARARMRHGMLSAGLDPRAEGTHQLELLSAGVDDPDLQRQARPPPPFSSLSLAVLVAVDDGIVQRARGVRGPANFASKRLQASKFFHPPPSSQELSAHIACNFVFRALIHLIANASPILEDTGLFGELPFRKGFVATWCKEMCCF